MEEEEVPPSQLPEKMWVRESGWRQREKTLSLWPLRAATKGRAKILSIFTALRARVYSRGFSKGCWAGSTLRCMRTKSTFRSLVNSASLREIVFTFCSSVGDVMEIANGQWSH